MTAHTNQPPALAPAPTPRRALFAAFACYVVLTVFLLWFVNHAVQESNLKWCRTLDAIMLPRPTPPTSDPRTNFGADVKTYQSADAARTRTIMTALSDLKTDYRCQK